MMQILEEDLLRIELPEARYAVDLKLYEYGQLVSARCLTLALAGIAVVGVFLPLLDKAEAVAALTDWLFKTLLGASTIAFAASAGVALLQQFLASGGMFHHIKAMKIAYLREPALTQELSTNLAIRLDKFMRAHTYLKATAALLVLGATLLGLAFIRLMVKL